MKTLPELRQAHAAAVEDMKTASAAITTTKAAARTAPAAEKAAAQTKADAAVKAYEDAKTKAQDLADEITRAEEAELQAVKSAKPRQAPDGTLALLPATVRSDADGETVKMAPVRLLVADMMQRHFGTSFNTEKWITLAYGESAAAVIKATQQLSNYSSGGALSLPDLAAFIIEGLDNVTVVRRMNPQVLNVPGSMVLPKETAAPNGGWVGENAVPTPGEFKFGDVKLDPKRLPIECVVSRKLLDAAQRGGAAVKNLEGYIVRRLRERLAVNEDAGFLRGSGTEHVPLGLRSQIAAANVFAISGTDPAQIETDLRKAVTKPKEANIVITGGHWIMPPRTVGKLADLRDANGNKIYPSIDVNNTLLRYPILETNQIPVNLGGGAATEIMFIDGPNVIVANGSDAQVRVSTEGSYTGADGKHYSLVQTNEILIHMELEADAKLERPEAGACITGVTY